MSTFQAIHGRKAMKAYTLIELMIYVFLSSIVVSSAFAGISSFYHNNFSHNGMFSILENARLLQESINHEVKKLVTNINPHRVIFTDSPRNSDSKQESRLFFGMTLFFSTDSMEIETTTFLHLSTAQAEIFQGSA